MYSHTVSAHLVQIALLDNWYPIKLCCCYVGAFQAAENQQVGYGRGASFRLISLGNKLVI